MSLDVDGFTEEIEGGAVTMTVSYEHRLLKLARSLPWDAMLEAILPDLQRTDKKRKCNELSDKCLFMKH